MYLKSLELSGFKSFARKTEILYNAPITAIVGPNGSGKSNIAEAFSFVLGEQSIKSMRGKRAEDFLNRVVHIALPRTKDFKGVSPTGIDEAGNLTIGIKEHSIFPEAAEEEIRDLFGLAVTIVTTAKNRNEARALFDAMGIPFGKNKEKR